MYRETVERTRCTASGRPDACDGDPRRRAVQARARADLAAVGARHDGRRRDGAELLRQQLPRPGRPPRRGRRRRSRRCDEWGFGMASVRFICGTQTQHTQLEARLSRVPRHRGHDPLLLLLRRQRRRVRGAASAPRTRSSPTSSTTPRSSTASGCARPRRLRYRNPTWPTSRRSSKAAAGRAPHASSSPTASSRWTATSPRSTRSATWPSEYDALVHGRRLARRRASSATAGARHARALRRAWTGSTSSPARSARRSAAPPAATSRARQEIVDLLRQRSRPYLFSNAVAPSVVAGSLAALELAAGLGERAGRAARPTPRCSGR